ncbi:MAG: NAD(P)/FAD-dependent oxidoreductase [Hyphomicrobiaceae bacterium]
MSEQSFDVIVIGAGPAGLEAAAVVASARLRVVAIDKMGPGGQLMNLGSLHGMPDLEPDITGPDLLGQIAERAMSAGAEIAIDDVSAVRSDDGIVVEALDGTYRASAAIIATGLTQGTTGLADETRFEGAGISHCAHCDAPLYAGRPVAVAGADAWAIEEAIELAEHAATVMLIAAETPIAAAERLDALKAQENIVVVEGTIVALEGATALEQVVVRGAGGEMRVPTSGLFLQTGRVPARDFLPADVAESGGVYFAGDVRGGAGRTIAEAIADGAEAGQNAVEWVRARKGA